MIRRSFLYRFALSSAVRRISSSSRSTVFVPRDEDLVVELPALVTYKVMEISTGFDASNEVVFTPKE